MNTRPKITVITASYNYENYIKDAITSVINQTYKNWELLVVDDGSKDNSIQVIQEFSRRDERIKLITHENNINKGLAETIKLALSHTNTEYVAFLESDDIWNKDNLLEKVQALQKYPNADFIFNDVECFGDEKAVEFLTLHHNKVREFLTETKDAGKIFEKMGFNNIVKTFSCVLVKTELLKKCNFNSPDPASLDWWLWYQIFYAGEIVFLDKKLTLWRKHSGSYMQSTKRTRYFQMELLRFIFEKSNNKFLALLCKLMSNSKIEKLFRPQVQYLQTIFTRKILEKNPFKIKYHTL